jgi:sarcosine/dimethylglycine N-methyltransferase
MYKQYDDSVVATAQNYYNSEDADTFYHTIWGGEDIHVGCYKSDSEPIFDASRRTVQKMADQISSLDKDKTVIDIGAGYGGAARYLAHKYRCNVVALNLSEVENERNRAKNDAQQVNHLIKVVDGNFEDVPYEDEHFDVVWSQDSILHSSQRDRVVQEAGRILKSGGDFVFTDPMMADDCPDGVLQPILDRIHLESLASPSFYRESAKKAGMKEKNFIDMTDQLVNHYGRVLAETEKNEDDLRNHVSQEYIDNMKKGLNHWVNGGESGYLTWGIFHFVKE